MRHYRLRCTRYLDSTAISELHQYRLVRAEGEVMMRSGNGSLKGILIVARDDGPGIRSIQDVLRDATHLAGLGLGLPASSD